MRRTFLGALILVGIGFGPIGCAGRAHLRPSGQSLKLLDVADRDLSTPPDQDFYQHANGGWLARTQIPADAGRWGTFEQLGLTILAQLRALVEDAAQSPQANDSPAQKVVLLYQSALNAAARDRAGSTPLQPYLTAIAGVRDADSLARTLAKLQALPANPLFIAHAEADAKQSTQVLLQLSQGGLGLPERDDYLLPAKQDLRQAYRAHLTAMFTLLGQGQPEAEAEAEAVLRLETALAEASLSPTARRDVQATYNRRTLAELSGSGPGFAWRTYFAALGLPDPRAINLENPAFMAQIDRLSHSVPWSDWQSYLRWHLLQGTARYLSAPFVQQDFAFYGTHLAGKPALAAPWKRALEACNAYLGEVVGQLYVARHFPPKAKHRAQALVADLHDAMGARLTALTWMGAATKQQARAKLAKLHVKIGYPDVWLDDGPLQLHDPIFFNNVARAAQFLWARDLAQIGKPVDRNRWGMTPQTVNAYYDPQLNEMVFPAAILQPPFFSADADDAYNYGGIGAVIGHEMIHGYDDQGRQFDADGNLRDWWTAADADAFDLRARRIAAQYDAYRVFDTPVQGALTRGENIADLGGVGLAHAALQRALERRGSPGPVDGLLPAQRFFFTYAQIWRNQIRRASALQRLRTDPHAPGQWRVNGPLSQLPAFAEAFDIAPGTPMHCAASERLDLW